MKKLLDINIQVLIYANTNEMLLMQVEYDRKTLKNIMIQIAIISQEYLNKKNIQFTKSYTVKWKLNIALIIKYCN